MLGSESASGIPIYYYHGVFLENTLATCLFCVVLDFVLKKATVMRKDSVLS